MLDRAGFSWRDVSRARRARTPVLSNPGKTPHREFAGQIDTGNSLTNQTYLFSY
jgi:hypothetical protein